MQRILVLQRDGLGETKVAAVAELAPDLTLRALEVIGPLDEVVDDPAEVLPADLDAQLAWADLVVDHLYHPDLSEHLVQRCGAAGVPVVAAGRKLRGAHTPTTCCTLPRGAGLGAYGERFGAPDLEVALDGERITRCTVRRGAPCGATWRAAEGLVGLTAAEALPRIGLVTQFHCVAKANPNVFLTNPLHVAGHVHIAALKTALAAADPTLDLPADDELEEGAAH